MSLNNTMKHDSSPKDISFCASFGDHRNRHSFPTRRSSDLLTIVSCHAGAVCPAPAIGVMLLVPRIAARSSDAELPYVRSEEHTSELQSRFDLVCRLLLEKKKNALPYVNTHPQKLKLHPAYA